MGRGVIWGTENQNGPVRVIFPPLNAPGMGSFQLFDFFFFG